MRQVFVLKSGAVLTIEGHKKMTPEEAEKFMADFDKRMEKAMAGLDEGMRWLGKDLEGLGKGLEAMGKALRG